MSSGDKSVSFIWTKEIFLRQSDRCRFLTKDELVYKNPLKRSVLILQFQNPRNLEGKDFFTRFTQKQLPIHDGTKIRLTTLSHQLLGGSLEVPTKYYVKITMM